MSKLIKKILYASDLEEGSKPAFLMAANEAFKHHAEMIFLYVDEPKNHNVEIMLENILDGGDLKQLQSSGIKKLQHKIEQKIDSFYSGELEDRFPVEQPITVKERPSALVESGPTAETIVSVANKQGVDLIILGTRIQSQGGFTRFFSRSVAQTVLELTDIPMLVVPISS